MPTVMHFYYYQQDNEVIRVMEAKNANFPNTKSSRAERYCLLHYYAYNPSHTFIVIHTLIFNRLSFQKCSLCQFRARKNIGIMCLRGQTLKAHNRRTEQPQFQLTIIALNGCGRWICIGIYKQCI